MTKVSFPLTFAIPAHYHSEMENEQRNYRHWVEGKSLVSFRVAEKETDLQIRATSNLSRKAHRLVLKYREQLEGFIEKDPRFLRSLEPITVPPNTPRIVKCMARAAQSAGVGPMAAVAGAMAEFVGTELLDFSPEVIVENGGDIFMKSLTDRVIGVYAGSSPLSGKIGLNIEAGGTPLGICTSSGTVGHSLSFGRADAVIVLAKSAVLADAAATATGNQVKSAEDMERALEFARGIEGVLGALIIAGDKLAAGGNVSICRTSA